MLRHRSKDCSHIRRDKPDTQPIGIDTDKETNLKKTIYTQLRNFRVSPALNDEIRILAGKVNRQESDLIREAVASYIMFYREHPNELLKYA